MPTLKELYTALREDGAPVPDSYDKFHDYMTSGPQNGYVHRREVYEALKEDGAPLPPTYEEFSRALFAPGNAGQGAPASGVEPSMNAAAAAVPSIPGRAPSAAVMEAERDAQGGENVQAVEPGVAYGSSAPRAKAGQVVAPRTQAAARGAGRAAGSAVARGAGNAGNAGRAPRTRAGEGSGLTGMLDAVARGARQGAGRAQAASRAGEMMRSYRLRRGGRDFEVPESEVQFYGGFEKWAQAHEGAPVRVYMRHRDGRRVHVPVSQVSRLAGEGWWAEARREDLRLPSDVQPAGGGRPVTAADRAYYAQQLADVVQDSRVRTQAGRRRVEGMADYQRAGEVLTGAVADDGMHVDPSDGKVKRRYLLPTGERTFDRAGAESVARAYRVETGRQREEARRLQHPEYEELVARRDAVWKEIRGLQARRGESIDKGSEGRREGESAWDAFVRIAGGASARANDAMHAHPTGKEAGISGRPGEERMKQLWAELLELDAAVRRVEQATKYQYNLDRLGGVLGTVENLGEGVVNTLLDPDTLTRVPFAGSVTGMSRERELNAAQRAGADPDAGRLLDSSLMSASAWKNAGALGAMDLSSGITRMMTDPLMLLAAPVGAAASRGMTALMGRSLLKGGTGAMAARAGASQLAARLLPKMAGGAAGGAASFGFYKGGSAIGEQIEHGGYVNPDTGENEGYSLLPILNSTAHGVVMGGLTGGAGVLLGNVADKYVRASGTAGKVALRGLEPVVSTVAEGTIFSIPEWIAGKRDAMDVWTDNLEMMAGFKAVGAVKGAPGFIRSLRKVKPREGRPLTRDERLQNNLSFVERLDRGLDRYGDAMAFTRDELAEMRRYGYGDFSELFRRRKDGGQGSAATKGAQLPAPVVEKAERVQHPELDNYGMMEHFVKDRRVSQAARAKAYFILTGRGLPMSMVTGYESARTEDGGYVVNAVATDGEVVTSRTFGSERESRREIEKIERQVELNTVDVGEKFRENEAAARALGAAYADVAARQGGMSAEMVRSAYEQAVRDLTDPELAESSRRALEDLVKEVEAAIQAHADDFAASTPEAIRRDVEAEYNVTIDAALRKRGASRSAAEKEALLDYVERLFPVEAREGAAKAAAPGQRAAEGGAAEAAAPGQNADASVEEPGGPRLSADESDEYGRPMVLSGDGTTTFGAVGEESGLAAAPIRLSLGENHVGEDGKNHGYGLLHIEAGHGDQIRAAGFQSVEEFVERVARSYTTIREGGMIAGNQTYLLEVPAGHNNTLFIQLSRDGRYWNVNSAGIFKERYSRRKPKVYDVPALSSDKGTDTTGVNSGHDEGATAPAGDSPETFGDKGSDFVLEKQGNGVESLRSASVEAAGAAGPEAEERPMGRAVMKYEDRPVEVMSGRVVMTEDGSMVDAERSDATVVVRDPVTGKVEMVAPEAILSYEDYAEPSGEAEDVPAEGAATEGEPRRKYTAGFIRIRNADGSESRGVLTGGVDEMGNYEYYVEGDTDRFHYASEQELDGMLTEYAPDEPAQPSAAQPQAAERIYPEGVTDTEAYDNGLEDGAASTSMSDEELNRNIERFSDESEVSSLTDYGRGWVEGLKQEQQRRIQAAQPAQPQQTEQVAPIEPTPAPTTTPTATPAEAPQGEVTMPTGVNPVGTIAVPQHDGSTRTFTVGKDAEGQNVLIDDRGFMWAHDGNGNAMQPYSPGANVPTWTDEQLSKLGAVQAGAGSPAPAQRADAEGDGMTGRSLTEPEARAVLYEMEASAGVAPEIELTIENWDSEFGEAGIVKTPIGEVKMGENQFTKLMRQGRNGKLGMVRPTLEHPDVVIETASEARSGDVAERESSYIFVRTFKKADGHRVYHFTSVTVSKGGREVVVSNQEKSRNRILRLMQEGRVIWHTPKDAATPSAEGQGLDYVQPIDAETATKGSGITPQDTPSEGKGNALSWNKQGNGGESSAGGSKAGVPGQRAEGAELPGSAEIAAGNAVSGDEGGASQSYESTQSNQSTQMTDAAPAGELTALERIPRDENDEPVFEMAESPEAGWDALVEMRGGDVKKAQVVAGTMAENKRKELDKARRQKPKGATPKAIMDSQDAIDAEVAKAEREYDMWRQMAGVEQRRQEAARAEQMAREEAERAERAALAQADKELAEAYDEVKGWPEAVERLQQTEPETMDEAAALVLSRNKLLWKDAGGALGMASETGLGAGERRKMFRMFATAENGGRSIGYLAGDPMREVCADYGIPYDESEARDALIGVLRGASVPSDVTRYIERARVEQARDIARYMEGERENFYRENYHMSADEYEDYEEVLLEEVKNAFENFDESEYNSNIAEEIAQRESGEENGLRINQENDASAEGADDGGGREVLSGEEASERRGAGEDARGREGSGRDGHALRDTQGGISAGSPAGGIEGSRRNESGDKSPRLGQKADARREVPARAEAYETGEVTDVERTEMEARILDWLSDDNLAAAYGKSREEIFEEFGNELQPIAYVPSRYIPLIGPHLQDSRIYCGKGYFIDHALRNHGDAGTQIPAEDVDASRYLNIQTVLDNPDHIKEMTVDGKRTVVFIKKIGRYFAELAQVEAGGKIVLHKSLFNQKKEPYAKLDDIRQKDTSSEGGTSSISHADNTAPAISLESRGDVISQKSVSASSADIETEPEGKRNGTATPQDGLIESKLQTAASQPHGLASERKGNALSSEKQGNGGESFRGGVAEAPGRGQKAVRGGGRANGADMTGRVSGGGLLSPAEPGAGTMYKKKKGTDSSDGLMPIASPSTPVAPSDNLSSVSNRKVNNSATEKQGSGQESSLQPSDNKREQTIQSAVEAASAQVNTAPTPAQAEAGNYRKGHVTIGEFDITIENPAGSVRKGVDAKTKKAWETTMANAYGYIKGTEGVDGDHIDVFLHSNMDGWNGRKVFVVDQTNRDGSFDEHKVMLGFNDKDEAMTAYLANYDKTWADTHPGLRISETGIDDFNKWVQSSHRKTKPFAEYTTVSKVTDADTADKSAGRDDKSVDNQGNPIDGTGKYVVEEIKSIEELSDEDFMKPTRNVVLPELPAKVADAIGAEGRKPLIKKNIFSKNRDSHKDLTADDGRRILNEVLYNPALYGQNQKVSRPYNWILVHLADKNSAVVLEVNPTKDYLEIVNWHYLGEEALERKKRQAVKGGGRILTLSLDNAVANTHDELSSDSKGSDFATEKQGNDGESFRGGVAEAPGRGQKVVLGEGGAESGDVSMSVGSGAVADGVVYDVMKGMLEIAGIPVVEVSGAEASEMAGKKNTPVMDQPNRANEKLTSGSVLLSAKGDSTSNANVPSEADAKIIKDTQKAKNNIKKFNNGDAKVETETVTDAIRSIGSLLSMRSKGGSRYTILRTDNGDTVAIRLADHRANGNNFTRDNADRNLSIVIERRRFDTPESEIEFTEATVPEEVFNARPQNVVDGIINGVEGLLRGGEFELDSSLGTVEHKGVALPASDTNRKAPAIGTRQAQNGNTQLSARASDAEVTDAKVGKNSETDKPRLLRTPKGVVYGWTVGGKVYLNRDAMNPETPVHEYTHLWDEMVRRENPELWARGVELLKETPVWNEVMRDPNYADIRDDEDAVASEVHSRLAGAEGARILEEMVEDARKDGVFAMAERVSLVERVKGWLRDMFKSLKKTLGKWSGRDLRNLTVEDFNRMTLRDLAEGMNPRRANMYPGNVRFQIIGERGASRMDRAEEATVRMDNLAVAREMEKAFKEKRERIEKLRGSRPVGTGIFGEIYNQFKGQVMDAVSLLVHKRSGDIIGVFSREGFGDVDFVWGDSRGGFSHIIDKHVGEGKSFATAEEAGQEIDRIIKYGDTVFENGDKAVFKDGEKTVTVRKNFRDKGKKIADKNWVLTAYDESGADDASAISKVDSTHAAPKGTSEVGRKGTNLLSMHQIDSTENARRIKFATGWERGADGKWRYEVPDFDIDPHGLARKNSLWINLPWGKEFDELSDKILEGEALTDEESNRYDEFAERAEEMRRTYEESDVRYLDDYVKDSRLFEAYPELKQVRVEMYSDAKNGIGATYYEGEELIRVNRDALRSEDLRSILAHEVQHAIQAIEGFARGGNGSTYREYMQSLKGKHDAWSVAMEFGEKSKELGNDASQMDVYMAVRDKYLQAGMTYGDGFMPSHDVFDTGFNLWARGYDGEGYEEAYNEYLRLANKHGLDLDRNKYNKLVGEVEARNVQARIDMPEEERRRTLLSETEDVSRDDQIFLRRSLGGGQGANAGYAAGAGIAEAPGRGQKSLRGGRADFDAVREQAVAERGIVMPGLAEKEVRVVEVPRHDFTGTGKQALQAAEKWAQENITGTHTATDSRGEEFEYSISNDAVEKYVSRSATGKSANIGVHLAALKKLPEIISESVEAEVHPDYIKHNGERNADGDVNPESLVHRFYGAVNIEGTLYRVKTTMREYADANRMPLAHSYEVTQIELLEAPSDGASKGSGEPVAMTSDSSIPGAKLLKGVEKSYDSGKKLLDESAKGKALPAEQTGDKSSAPEQRAAGSGPAGEVTDGGVAEASGRGQKSLLGRSADFDAVREQAVAERGIVMPGLAEKEVRVVEVPRHDFTGERPIAQARRWAKENIVGEHVLTDSRGVEVSYTISGRTVDKYLSASAIDNSDNLGVHLSVLKMLPEVISESVEAEVHPDYKKGADGKRRVENGYNTDKLIHRFYGAANIDGKTYRVKTTVAESRIPVEGTTPHSFEVTEIELLSEGNSPIKMEPTASDYQGQLPHGTAKLLKGVEKSYDSGKKLLDESASADAAREDGLLFRESEADAPAVGARDVDGALTSEEAKSRHAEELAERFGTPVHVVTDASVLPAGLRGRKGWYDPATGKVVLVLPNHADVADVAETVFHEVVAHKGLRELIGEENYDAFCDEVYSHLKDELKEQVDKDATRRFMRDPERGYDYHRRVAVDELFGRMAEKGFEDFTKAERGIWAKLRDKVLEAINRFLGSLKLPKWVRLGDNELRYMLWRSHERLGGLAEARGRNKNNAPDYVEVAKDVAKREELGLNRDDALRVENAKRARIEKLRKSEPVEISGTEIEYSADLKQYKKNAVEYGKRLQGDYINEDTGRSVQLQRGRRNGGIKEVLQHDLSDSAHIQSVAAIPGIIRKSIYMETQPNRDVDKNPDVRGYEHYVCGLKIGGEDYTVHSIVAEDKNGNRYYDHKLSHIEKGKLLDFIDAKQPLEQILAPMPDTKSTIRSERKIRELISLLQINEAESEDKTRKSVSQRVLSLMKSEHLTSVTDGPTLNSEAKLPKFFDTPTITEEESLHYRFHIGLNRDDALRVETNENEQEAVNRRFNAQLQRWETGTMRPEEIVNAGYPMGTMRQFLPNIPIILRQKVLSKSRKKHGLTAKEIQDLPKALAHPIFVFKSNEETVSILTTLKSDNGKNLFVAVELKKDLKLGGRTMEVNDILTIHGREIENVVLPIIENDSLKWVDKDKGLEWLLSAKSNSQAIAAQTLDDAAKIVKTFVNPTITEEESLNYRFRDEETSDILKDQSVGLEERITNAAIRLSEAQREDRGLRNEARWAILKNLRGLLKEMRAGGVSASSAGGVSASSVSGVSASSVSGTENEPDMAWLRVKSGVRSAGAVQRRFDRSTVKRVADLARVLMQTGYLSDLKSGEVQRLLSAVKNSAGRNDVSGSVQKIMDIMVDNQLRNGEAALRELLALRDSRVNARGVVVQGRLDAGGQEMIRTFESFMHSGEQAIREALTRQEGMRANGSERAKATAEARKRGMELALEYQQKVVSRQDEENSVRSELEALKGGWNPKLKGEQRKAYFQAKEALCDAIMKAKIAKAEALQALTEEIEGGVGASKERARAYREKERRHAEEIRHWVNADFEGRAKAGHMDGNDRSAMGRIKKMMRENVIANFLLDPMCTYEQVLRLCGSHNPYGEGYLYHGFMDAWVDAVNKEWEVKERYREMLDAKARELTGGSYNKLYSLAKKGETAKVSYYDGAEVREYELDQGQMLYLYGVEQMPMGQATNRAMGITDEDMERITRILDPKLRAFADWRQETLSRMLRDEANEVHMDVFGAEMDEVEMYFPFVRDTNAMPQQVENGTDHGADRPSISTGVIIKRKPSVVPWDMPKCNYLDVCVKNIDEIAHLMAFARLDKDLGTLLSDYNFKQKLMGMHTVYGSGEELFERVRQVCAIATDSYSPKQGRFDALSVRLAKGVAMSKITGRVFTAAKQALSLPAFFGEVNVKYMAESIVKAGVPAVKWCMKNLPNYRKRIKSRTAGDYRLRETEYDTRVMKFFSKGMLPNIGMDALTIAMGTYPYYQTRRDKYLRMGLDKEEAERRAKNDAVVCFNKSQQSAEGAFVSQQQVDHTFWTTTAQLFRSSSRSYTANAHTAARNLKRMADGEVSVDFVAKQMLRMKGVKTYTERFDSELALQIAGKLPEGHVYQLGMPGWKLQSAGVEDLPIELSAERLAQKASESYRSAHPFELAAVKGLPGALNAPIAVFDSATRAGVKVILTTLRYKGHNFVVALEAEKRDGGRSYEADINNILSLYPKDSVRGILGWINGGKMLYCDEKKMRAFFLDQWPNYIVEEEEALEVSESAGERDGENPGDVDLNALAEAANIVNNFENPDAPEQKAQREWSEADWMEARKMAQKEIREAWRVNAANLAIFGWILPFLWRVGGMLPVLLASAVPLLLGGDSEDDKKRHKDNLKKQIKDAALQSTYSPLEGLTFGDVLVDGLNIVSGFSDKELENLGRSNPLFSDLMQMGRHFDSSWQEGANDVLNILFSTKFGADPRTLTDVLAACMDFQGFDHDMPRELALLFARVMNVPQSQLDRIYIDELGLSAREARGLSPKELAERYAAYKVRRGNFATMWAMNDSIIDGLKEPWVKRFNKEAKSRLEARGEEGVSERFAAYDAEWSETGRRLREARENHDNVGYAERAAVILQSPEGVRYLLYEKLHPYLNKMIKSWLEAESAEDAAREAEAIVRYKAKVVEMLDSWENPGRSGTAGAQADAIASEWESRHKPAK